MSCKYCTIPPAEKWHDGVVAGGMCVGEWCFTEEDDLTHRANGRISLWYDDDDKEWAVLLLIDQDNMKNGILPSCAQFNPRVCPFCGRELQVPKWLWRLECPNPENGLWYNDAGKWVWDLGKLDCSTKDIPMGYDWRYKKDGRDWFSSCSSKEDLLHWYSEEDAKKLQSIGFVMARYLAQEYVEYEMETTFIKDTAMMREEVPLDGLWS